MHEYEKSEGTTEVRVDRAKKERPPRSVNFNVKLADGHYIVSFDYGPPRIFHNMEELLRAIALRVNGLVG